MKIRLKITAADQAFSVEHAGPTLTIGRDPACELALQGKASDLVSRRHAQIDLTPDGAVVRDLDSGNDTLLNDRPIRGHGDRPLRAGDNLRMGYTGATLEVLELDLTPADEPTVGRAAVPLPYLLGAAALLIVVMAVGRLAWPGQGKPAGEVVTTRPDKDAVPPPKGDTPAPPPTLPRQGEPSPVLPVKAPALDERPVGRYVPAASWPSLLLQRQYETGLWVALQSGEPVLTATLLVAPPGCEGHVGLDSGLRLTLWGSLPQLDGATGVLEAAAVLSVPESGFDLDLALERGRVRVVNPRKGQPARVRIRFLREVWTLMLPPGGGGVVELTWDAAALVRRNASWPVPVVAVLYTLGGVQLDRGGRRLDLPAKTRLVWASDAAGLEQETLPAPPDWLSKPPRLDRLETQVAALALQGWAARLAPSRDVVDTLLTHAREAADADERALGVLFLAGLDDMTALLEFLDDRRPEPELRATAVGGLRGWLVRTGRDTALERLFQQVRRYSAVDARAVVRLLLPPRREELERPARAAELAELLDHDKLAVRHLAEGHLYLGWAKRLTDPSRAPGYDPLADRPQRQMAVEAWRQLLRERTPFKPLPEPGA